MQDEIINEYFEWIYGMMCVKRYSKEISYRKLLSYLHSTEFIVINPRDINRAEDGLDLRYRFSLYNGYDGDIPKCLDGPCSILEMIVALAIRCEETIMDDPSIGDRTSQWFWGMITSLGLGSMNDEMYDRDYVIRTIDRFLNRSYEPNGKGGLFTIYNCKRDLRTLEIWDQLCLYLDNLI